jgi:ADP-ribosylglycohydrolase
MSLAAYLAVTKRVRRYSLSAEDGTYVEANLTSSTQPDQRMTRALCSLQGLSVGDALGQHWMVYFLRGAALTGAFPQDEIPPPPWYFTDDTTMAHALVSQLQQNGLVDQDRLAAEFAAQFMEDPYRGYGAGMLPYATKISNGQPWREASGSQFSGLGSFGNGAAMRVAPLGAYFADSLEPLVDQAQRSAEVTHAHPEGIAGAIAIAVGAAWAWLLRERGIRPSRAEYLDQLLPLIPESEVRATILKARDLSARTTAEAAAAKLGNGSLVSAQDTVPFALWCAGQYLDDYATAIRQTLRGGGDLDTTCAMVGGIVVLFGGVEHIPPEWISAREPLPPWTRDV